ncbi:MAG: hypothetical protein AAGN64_07640 [Bacteroidota bacterium]
MDRLDGYLEEVEQLFNAQSPSSQDERGMLAPWPSALDPDGSDIAAEAQFVDSLEVFGGRGAVALGREDQILTQRPAVVLVIGDLMVTGPLNLAPGSLIVATGKLAIGPDVVASDVLMYAQTLEVSGATLQGQFLSRTGTRLDGGSRLTYPSVVYVEGEDTAPVRVDGRRPDVPQGLLVSNVTVDGTLLYPALGGATAGIGATVQLTPEARIRGAVYANTRTEAAARLDGTLLTRQLYFYEAPATYVNWLRAGTLNRSARPESFALPVGFDAPPSLQRTDEPRYEVVSWREHITTARTDV